jgi:hypothetical protein
MMKKVKKMMNFKSFLLTASVIALAGCSATSDHSQVDQGDGIDTPDPILQDISTKQIKYGEKDYGLAKDGKEHDQQIKPDPLEQSLADKSQSTKGSPQSTKQSTAQRSTQQEQVKVAKKKPLTEAQRRKQDSALEVADPLLGEVEPS